MFSAGRVASLLGLALHTVTAATFGELRWSYAPTNSVQSVRELAPAVAADGTVYFPNGPYLDALTAGGELKWRFDPGFSQALFQTPTIRRDGTILATTDQFDATNLFALNPVNGAVVWSSPYLAKRVAEGLNRTFVLNEAGGGGICGRMGRILRRHGPSSWRTSPNSGNRTWRWDRKVIFT